MDFNDIAERALAVAAVAAAVVFIAVGIERPLFLDEANSVIIASHNAAGILDSLSRDNNLPLYYFLLGGWMRAFGNSEVALRSLSALFYLGGCGVAFLLGRRVAGDARCGAYAGFFYLASALAVRQAQNIRMYALLGLLAGLATWALLRALDRGRGWVAYGAVAAAGVFAHVWFAFVLIAHGVAVLLFARRLWWRFGVTGAIAVAPFAALWLPRFLGQMRNGATDWMPPLTWGIVAAAPVEFFGVISSLFLFALAGLGLRHELPRRAAMMLVLFAVSLAAPLTLSLVRPIYWPGRYAIIALMPLAAVLGTVLARTAPRPVLVTVCLVVLGLEVSDQVAGRDRVPDAVPQIFDGDRRTALTIVDGGRTGDAVVFTSLTRAPAEYYFTRAGATRRFAKISFPAEDAQHLGWSDPTVTAARRPVLEAEAQRMAENLREIAARGGQVWLYDGFATEVSGHLKQKLDALLVLRRTYEIPGAYHKRLLLYSATESVPVSASASR